MVNETTVRSFLTLARVGSFTEAAKQLYLSQQAVSKHVAKLEQDLDCILLNRERGRLTLTEVGEIYYEAFSRMDTILTAARTEAGRLNADQRNTLVVGQLELLDVRRFCKEFYRSFQSQNPDIQMTYKSGSDWNALDWLEEGSADVAFTFENEVQDREDLNVLRIARLREMLVVSADHPNARPDATYLDFREEPVFYTPVPESGEEQMVRRMESMGFPTDHLVRTENILSSCSSIDLMLGVSFMTEGCQMLDSKRYRAYPTNQSTVLVMAYRKSNKKRALRKFMEEASRQLALRE